MKHCRTIQLFLIFVISSLMMIPTLSFAAEKPDFTGQWVLNESKSDLGGSQGFATIKLVVKQEGNSLDIERTRTGRDGEERTSSETLTMDGKENVDEGENRTTRSTASWSEDGTSLTITSKREFSRNGETMEMNSTEVWTLADGGKTLKIENHSSSSRGDRSATLIYEKQ